MVRGMANLIYRTHKFRNVIRRFLIIKIRVWIHITEPFFNNMSYELSIFTIFISSITWKLSKNKSFLYDWIIRNRNGIELEKKHWIRNAKYVVPKKKRSTKKKKQPIINHYDINKFNFFIFDRISGKNWTRNSIC